MAQGYDHLILDERRQIFHLRDARQPVGVIAVRAASQQDASRTPREVFHDNVAQHLE